MWRAWATPSARAISIAYATASVEGRRPGAADPLLQRLALDVLEHDVGPAVVLAVVDHPNDVGMRQLRHRAGLAPEALELVGVAGDLAVHQLDRNLALQRLIGAPDTPSTSRLTQSGPPADSGR